MSEAGDKAAGAELLHGGRLRAARRHFPDAPEPLIDLSTGINPRAYPLPAPEPEQLTRLPEPEAEQALREAAARAYGAPSPDCVAAAPGTQILIGLLPSLLPATHAVILSPTYGEHRAAWARAGAAVQEVADHRALLDAAAAGTVLVLCNPNNPDGRRLSAGRLQELVARAGERGASVVVDEAFADLEPDVAAAAALLPDPRLFVLRSFGKTYGLAGLRLGTLLAHPHHAARLRAILGPWAVSGPALAAGLLALPDTGWKAREATRLRADAARLDGLLGAAGLTVLGGTCLFRLAEHKDAPSVRERLGRAGILVRHFPERPRWLRFGLPADEAQWQRIDDALRV